MTSTVACIGFTDIGSLAGIVRERGSAYHELSGTTQWVDSSGAMLLLERAGSNACPALRTDVRLPYVGLTALESGLAAVQLATADGLPVDALTVIPGARYTVGWAASGHVALVAMGLDVEFFPTAEDFFDSPRSAMPGSEGEPPPEVRQFGLPWPPPMEIESVLPAHDATPTATISGTVQTAQKRVNSLSEHEFLVTRIATLFGEIDLCTPVPVDGVPAPGAVAVGVVELVALFPAHGEPDHSSYAPGEKISATYRDGALAGEGSPADLVLDPGDIALPEGLVLGDDGAVRTVAEHRAWKGITDVAQPTTPQPAPAPPAASSTPETPADDAPLPGETRREWRARTGRN